jgi:hypothetical protein
MLARYKQPLKLKKWTYGIAKRSTMLWKRCLPG